MSASPPGSVSGPLRIREVRLQNFRNIPQAAVDFPPDRPVFILGPNGQGKTNLLEAIGLITALRSFRTHEIPPLLHWGTSEAGVRVLLDHPVRGETEFYLTLAKGRKHLRVDGEEITRLGSILGLFPTVAFSSQDIQLLRGAPLGRRQFLDLSLSATDATYYSTLRRYHGALKERNQLLKQGADPSLTRAFDAILLPAGAALMEKRRAGLAAFASDLEEAYRRISPTAEEPELRYAPDISGASADTWQQTLESARLRDREVGTTTRGPHRDDWELRLKGHAARPFASEGQQRGLVLALRVAQARWFARHGGAHPVILADDILGELDPQRRERFWKALDHPAQIIATGTALPGGNPGEAWAVIEVAAGQFHAIAPQSPPHT